MKKKLIYSGIAVILVGFVIALSVYFARSGGGEININDRIRSTDQTKFEHEVLPDTRAVLPNGGLHPQGGESVPKPPAPQAPIQSVSSTSPATSTPEVHHGTSTGGSAR